MRFFSRALVLFWAAILMVSSTCFGADIHFCEGEAQSFALFETAKPCKMHKKKVEKKVRKCCMARKKVQQEPSRGFPIAKNGKCCYNDQVSFKTDGETAQLSIDLSAHAPNEYGAFNDVDGSMLWNQANKVEQPFRGPPDRQLIPNYQIFFQVFRI